MARSETSHLVLHFCFCIVHASEVLGLQQHGKHRQVPTCPSQREESQQRMNVKYLQSRALCIYQHAVLIQTPLELLQPRLQVHNSSSLLRQYTAQSCNVIIQLVTRLIRFPYYVQFLIKAKVLEQNNLAIQCGNAESQGINLCQDGQSLFHLLSMSANQILLFLQQLSKVSVILYQDNLEEAITLPGGDHLDAHLLHLAQPF